MSVWHDTISKRKISENERKREREKGDEKHNLL